MDDRKCPPTERTLRSGMSDGLREPRCCGALLDRDYICSSRRADSWSDPSDYATFTHPDTQSLA